MIKYQERIGKWKEDFILFSSTSFVLYIIFYIRFQTCQNKIKLLARKHISKVWKMRKTDIFIKLHLTGMFLPSFIYYSTLVNGTKTENNEEKSSICVRLSDYWNASKASGNLLYNFLKQSEDREVNFKCTAFISCLIIQFSWNRRNTSL